MTQHRFIPNTNQDQTKILQTIGVKSFDELLMGIPGSLKETRPLSIEAGLSEHEIRMRVQELMTQSKVTQRGVSFLGAGVYDHFCPSLVNQTTLRGEFLTSYTPYQPEMSQGTLQALYEFQSMVATLFAMPLSNGSHYDGATSTAEAVLMAARIQPTKKQVLISAGLHPQYLEVIQTYVLNLGLELVMVPLNAAGQTCEKTLAGMLNSQSACVVVQSPNFFGVVEDQGLLATKSKAQDALFISVVTETLSLGVLKAPGQMGADIATGEGQSLGIPMSFGGPYVGLFTAKDEYVRQMPGRLCGMSVDAQNRRAFTLTLSTREQHIRREKATSNICTNQNLMALWSCIWMAMVGKEGFREMAIQNMSKAQFAAQAMVKTGKVDLRFPSSKFFNEFTVQLKNTTAAEFVKACVEKEKLAPGLALSSFHPQDKNGLLVCVTELKNSKEIERLVQCLTKYA